ncbi:hypothetical protein FBY40_0229 [Microbacterium sp. SLBN-154]|uniref:hypothetical protein n=1 Tax=Microbacterium sp. SLBN-154 TaxID=2768458 RepID=UPI00114FE3C8|nr:hypothetical protein [Microbacterium sp. SLBN-154]TQK17752.1 hypothetical protein FBY40_0229 [Microbacterium sp. SLBN-154]
MTRSIFSTVRTIVSVREDGQSDTGRLIVRREDDLNQHGREGYTLTHTFTITTPETITVVDTLQKTIED